MEGEKIIPIGRNIVVREIVKEKNTGGVILPIGHKDSLKRANIIRLSEQIRKDSDLLILQDPGVIVLYERRTGIEIDGVSIINFDRDVRAIIV